MQPLGKRKKATFLGILIDIARAVKVKDQMLG